jgi:hypothetical protein
MRPLAARCHLGLGRLAQRAGDGSSALKHLATAREGFLAMRMTFWLDRLSLDPSDPDVVRRPEV